MKKTKSQSEMEDIEAIQSIMCHSLKACVQTYGKIMVKKAICKMLDLKTLNEVDQKPSKFRMLKRL